MQNGLTLIESIASRQNLDTYQQENWHGSFADYLDIAKTNPKAARSAHQRLYDMIMSYGTYSIEEGKEELTRYTFFDDPDHDGEDAIFGLTKPLMAVVNVFKSAALKYGAEKRVLLLHGPVGSSKSTIARLLKRGLERYSRSDEGAIYAFGWKEEDGSVMWDPMNGDPLQLIPMAHRPDICAWLNESRGASDYDVEINGDICPLSRFVFKERLEKYNGDWSRVLQDVIVRRVVLSEQDRIGIGTFQPKDEKNQDSTELTGDINYRKI
ncbi:MAG: serine protein kinase, partial [Planctomycetota bacterium]|nr:serine protein kinase [Planctomycetota bacterium]